MNKYFINENWCIRFKKENSEICSDRGTTQISDLYFLKYSGHARISKDKGGWLPDFADKYKKYYREVIANKNYIFEFETDDEAILMYEGLQF